MSSNNVTFDHVADANERDAAAAWRPLKWLRSGTPRPGNQPPARRRHATEPCLDPELLPADPEDDPDDGADARGNDGHWGGGDWAGGEDEPAAAPPRAAGRTHAERMAALRAFNDARRGRCAELTVAAAPAVAALRTSLARAHAASMQAALATLALACVACGSALLSAAISVTSVAAVQIIGLGGSYVVDLPLTLSCGHSVNIQPEDVGCIGIYTDASASGSSLWLENPVMDMVHSLVGHGTTFSSASCCCRAHVARILREGWGGRLQASVPL